jgi:D-alanyl-D-alanine carboxypeptidase
MLRVFAMGVICWLPMAGPAVASPPAQEPPEPQITAQSAILVEYPSGRILYQKAAHQRMAPASLTKILTAILALEYGNLDDAVTIVPDDLVGESSMGLQAGETQKLRDLLYGLLLPSGNDAAMAIARALGPKVSAGDSAQTNPVARFVDLMNVRVAQLGLTDSHFVNPHGLDAPDHYSTAYDLASLSWYALHLPTFNEIVRQVHYPAPGHPLLNTNEMLTRYPGADGIKTGWTDACGLCLITSATRGEHRLISVVLNAPKWYNDSAALLDYGFAKLAAVPADDTAERLAISQRGTASWVLSGVGTPPAQGGGAAPTPASRQKVAAPLAPVQSQPLQLQPPLQPRDSSSHSALPATADLIKARSAWSGLPVSLLVVAGALLGAVLCLVLARRTRSGAFSTASAMLRLRPHRHPRSLSTSGTQAGAGASASYIPPLPVARTLGQPPLPLYRRREPNLLLTDEDRQNLHVERAIMLACEGRQGASMSEFLLAFELGAGFTVSELAERYQLTPSVFLALARAQFAHGDIEEARRTLVHAVLVMPHDRLLRLALSQLQAQTG